MLKMANCLLQPSVHGVLALRVKVSDLRQVSLDGFSLNHIKRNSWRSWSESDNYFSYNKHCLPIHKRKQSTRTMGRASKTNWAIYLCRYVLLLTITTWNIEHPGHPTNRPTEPKEKKRDRKRKEKEKTPRMSLIRRRYYLEKRNTNQTPTIRAR